jgi:hypothetical protein
MFLAIRRCDAIQNVVKIAVICGCVVGCVYCGIALPVKYAPGDETVVKVVVDWLWALRVDTIVSLTGCGALFWWAMSEKRKRIREREERDRRLKKFEQEIDPGRSGSGLSVDGAKILEQD